MSKASIDPNSTLKIQAESDDSVKQKPQELAKMAEEHCPAVYNMSHEIKVSAQIE